MMNMYKFPYRFEPMPEIADRLNLAWFDEHYGEERMKDHIRKHKLKSHQYKAYVNYWWLKERRGTHEQQHTSFRYNIHLHFNRICGSLY